jgi:hypothetical protein
MMTKPELIERMKALSSEMLEVGILMDHYGGLTEMGKHGHELMSASSIVFGWAEGWEDNMSLYEPDMSR